MGDDRLQQFTFPTCSCARTRPQQQWTREEEAAVEEAGVVGVAGVARVAVAGARARAVAATAEEEVEW